MHVCRLRTGTGTALSLSVPEQLVYGRGGQKTAMTALVDELRSRPPCRTRSPSMNNEEPIQVISVGES
jgi:hypothetical protein